MSRRFGSVCHLEFDNIHRIVPRVEREMDMTHASYYIMKVTRFFFIQVDGTSSIRPISRRPSNTTLERAFRISPLHAFYVNFSKSKSVVIFTLTAATEAAVNAFYKC